MYFVPSHKPASEVFGAPVTVSKMNEVEKRLQMLGIRNSVIGTLRTNSENGEEDKGKNDYLDATHLTLPAQFSYDFELKEPELIRRSVVEPESKSIWVWVWREWLSYHGNCALCDRPLNAAIEPVVMNTCAHAVHVECAEEARINAKECPRCVAKRQHSSSKCTMICCCAA
uniref:RING-type domain-containing protein n=1 Tax=Ascaris lumbricoides TaxID=6252 RepID=A0A9J2PL08_ASCLU